MINMLLMAQEGDMQEQMNNVSREMKIQERLQKNATHTKNTVTEVKNFLMGLLEDWTQPRSGLCAKVILLDS